MKLKLKFVFLLFLFTTANAQEYPDLFSYKETHLAFELELKADGLARFIDAFVFNDPAIDDLKPEEKAKKVIEDIIETNNVSMDDRDSKLLQKMTPRPNIDQYLRLALAPQEWVVGGHVIEFRHLRTEDDPHDFWRDLEILLHNSGTLKKFNDPASDPDGPWHSVHFNFSFEGQETKLLSAQSLNTLKALEFIADGKKDALLGSSLVAYNDVQTKGLFHMREKYYELRSYNLHPKKELERAMYFMSIDESLATKELAKKIVEEVKKSDWKAIVEEPPLSKVARLASNIISGAAADPNELFKLYEHLGEDTFLRFFEKAMTQTTPPVYLAQMLYGLSLSKIPQHIKDKATTLIEEKISSQINPTTGFVGKKKKLPSGWTAEMFKRENLFHQMSDEMKDILLNSAEDAKVPSEVVSKFKKIVSAQRHNKVCKDLIDSANSNDGL